MFGPGTGYTDWWCGPGAFFPGPWGLIVTLFFWGFVILLVIWLFQVIFGSRSRTDSSAEGNNALQTLEERYARGELSRDEFGQIKKDLL